MLCEVIRINIVEHLVLQKKGLNVQHGSQALNQYCMHTPSNKYISQFNNVSNDDQESKHSYLCVNKKDFGFSTFLI